MAAPKVIIELVERFQRNIKDYQSGKYNETQVRLEFIDPFFEALGWDVHNKKGYAEAYKDVIHEDQIKIGGATKAPDYCFRIGGTRKFFVEAKKPSIDIKEDTHPAYQLRRYAWSAKLPLSLLTDFEELAIYDCRIRPVKTDKSGTARVMYFTYKDYIHKWEEISEIFSRESVLQGSFDRYAESTKRKRGTAEVDTAFLEEIERWRENLARNIALRNKGLTVRDLNFAVQRTIDRIIFLRIGEDRGLEPYGRLRNIARQKNTYNELCKLYQEADNRYNSGLFYFKSEKSRSGNPDELTTQLEIDDKVIQSILQELYYPDSPYEFSVLPADILGQVYEQFLGKIIRLTPGGMAKIEDKPEVKKAGGVYYTPTYIVDYIVQQTVGELLEEKTPNQVSELRILDPACGSGSFLLGAYQYLLDWHRDYYVNNAPEKYTRAVGGRIQTLYQGTGGDWRLTTAEKRRILLNNIYGVDIDPQAVEVTKLSLLLKVLEDENEGSLGQQLTFFQERALPDLGSNIKCGNSLVGPEYYKQNGKQISMFKKEEIYRINAFDWDTEFPDIVRLGGFDIVIGNPPYISVEGIIKDVTEYYLQNYFTSYGRVNSFSLFLEKSLVLVKENGVCGFIVSNRIMTNTQLTKLRERILDISKINKILSFKKGVFNAAVDTVILIYQKCNPTDDHTIEILYDIEDLDNSIHETNSVRQSTFSSNEYFIFNIRQKEENQQIIKKIKLVSTKLINLCNIKDGIILGSIKDLFLSDTWIDERYKKWLDGNEVSRYSIEWTGRYICYDNSLINQELIRKKKIADSKAVSYAEYKKISRSGVWLRVPEIFMQPKILTRQNAKRIIGVFDEENFFVKNSLHCTLLKDGAYNLKYILGLINSRVLDFYFQDQIGNTGEIFSQMKIQYLKQLPIRSIDFNNPAEIAKHDRIVSLVEFILQLNKQQATEKTPTSRQIIKRQIEITDNQIDSLVYELYGLTEEEISIVEESK